MKLLVITSRWLLLVEKWKKTYLNIQCQPVFPDRQCKEVFFSRYSSTCSHPSSETNSCRFVLKTRQSKLHFWSVDLKNTCGQEHRKDHWGIRTRIHWFFNWKWIYRQYFTHKVVGCFWLSMPACLMHHTHFTAFKHTFLPRDGYAPGPSPTFSLFTACCPSCHTTISQGSQLPSPHSPRSPLSHSGTDQKLWKRGQVIAMLTPCHAIQSKIPYSESVTEQAQVCPNSRVSSSLSNLDWNSLSRNAEKELLSSAQTQSSQSTSTVKLSSPHSGPIVALATLRCCLSKESAAT